MIYYAYSLFSLIWSILTLQLIAMINGKYTNLLRNVVPLFCAFLIWKRKAFFFPAVCASVQFCLGSWFMFWSVPTCTRLRPWNFLLLVTSAGISGSLLPSQGEGQGHWSVQFLKLFPPHYSWHDCLQINYSLAINNMKLIHCGLLRHWEQICFVDIGGHTEGKADLLIFHPFKNYYDFLKKKKKTSSNFSFSCHGCYFLSTFFLNIFQEGKNVCMYVWYVYYCIFLNMC